MSGSDQCLIARFSRRGYTIHTMLGNAGLIRMNGRIMDASIERFMSAHPYVSEPGNKQGCNRYSYVNNNPLSFIDPSGFEGSCPPGTEDTGNTGWDGIDCGPIPLLQPVVVMACSQLRRPRVHRNGATPVPTVVSSEVRTSIASGGRYGVVERASRRFKIYRPSAYRLSV